MGHVDEMVKHESDDEVPCSSKAIGNGMHALDIMTSPNIQQEEVLKDAMDITMSPTAQQEVSKQDIMMSSTEKQEKVSKSQLFEKLLIENSQLFKKLLINFLKSIYPVLIKAKVNVLLPFGPLAILLNRLTHKQGWILFFSFLGLIPSADRLGYATEQLAFYTGPTVGGLLKAVFGNATEMIISIYALKVGMLRVIQQALLGSILSNVLLVPGCAFFVGGLVHYRKVQIFNKAASLVNSGLLLMAVMGIMFPAVLNLTRTEGHFGMSVLTLSRFTSCIMLVAYGSYVFFQIKGEPNKYMPIIEEESDTQDDNDDKTPELTCWEAITWLAILILWVSVLSGYHVHNIQGASVSWNVPVAFISVILLPLVSSAADIASAIKFAIKDKLDCTLGIAIGSATRISMFVTPFCVVVGWLMGQPMDLNFQLFETATLFITVLVIGVILQDGTSNYFKGLMLVFSYIIVAASSIANSDPRHDSPLF